MTNKDFEERGDRKLSRMGGESVGLTLPIELVRKLGWKVKQKVTVKRFGKNRLVVEDWKK